VIKEIGAGVGGDAQLREDDQLHVRRGGLRQRRANLLHVVRHIRHAQRRRAARHAHKAEFLALP
jgi:hypothetical protein